MSSFSYLAKQELCKVPLRNPTHAQAELAGMLHTNGALHLNSSGARFVISTEHDDIVTRVFALTKEVFGQDCELSQSQNHLKRETYAISIRLINPGEMLETLFYKQGMQIDACRLSELLLNVEDAAYIRGAFLGGGSVSDPKKEYHLEFLADTHVSAELLTKILKNGHGPSAKINNRKDRYVVYIKGFDSICNIFAYIGAHKAVLELENIRIEKEIRGNVNRQINWESANIDRAVRSAVSQLENIALIERMGGLSTLSAPLQEAAELRRAYPEATLAELAELSKSGASRSAMNNRFRKLAAIAKELGEES